MFKLLVFICALTVAFCAEIFYAPGTYYAPGATVYARSSGIVPLTYSRFVAAPSSAVETYNSVATPDSFQQQYRSDVRPYVYQYLN